MPQLPHKIKITRVGLKVGTQNEDTGALTTATGDPKKIFEGKGFFLDEGVALERNTAGVPTLQADGQVVLPKKTVGKYDIQEGDVVLITYPDGDTKDATVLKAVRFTDILYVKRA